MNSVEKWIEAQKSLVDVVLDLALEMNALNDYEAIEISAGLMDKLSTIIKRMGETTILTNTPITTPPDDNDIKPQEEKEGEEV